MTEPQRERLFRALVGKVEGMSAATVVELEKIAAEQLREIEPVVEQLMTEAWIRGLWKREITRDLPVTLESKSC